MPDSYHVELVTLTKYLEGYISRRKFLGSIREAEAESTLELKKIDIWGETFITKGMTIFGICLKEHTPNDRNISDVLDGCYKIFRDEIRYRKLQDISIETFEKMLKQICLFRSEASKGKVTVRPFKDDLEEPNEDIYKQLDVGLINIFDRVHELSFGGDQRAGVVKNLTQQIPHIIDKMLELLENIKSGRVTNEDNAQKEWLLYAEALQINRIIFDDPRSRNKGANGYRLNFPETEVICLNTFISFVLHLPHESKYYIEKKGYVLALCEKVFSTQDFLQNVNFEIIAQESVSSSFMFSILNTNVLELVCNEELLQDVRDRLMNFKKFCQSKELERAILESTSLRTNHREREYIARRKKQAFLVYSFLIAATFGGLAAPLLSKISSNVLSYIISNYSFLQRTLIFLPVTATVSLTLYFFTVYKPYKFYETKVRSESTLPRINLFSSVNRVLQPVVEVPKPSKQKEDSPGPTVQTLPGTASPNSSSMSLPSAHSSQGSPSENEILDEI